MWAAKMQFTSSYIHDNQTNEIWSTDNCIKFFGMEDMQLTNIVCITLNIAIMWPETLQSCDPKHSSYMIRNNAIVLL